jgi:DNA-binding MarR family transcriptional regulator
MSKTVEGLVQRGLLARSPHSHDRRQVQLALTKKGNTLLQKVRKAAQESLCQKMMLLNAEERSELKKGLIQLTKLFQLNVPKNFI